MVARYAAAHMRDGPCPIECILISYNAVASCLYVAPAERRSYLRARVTLRAGKGRWRRTPIAKITSNQLIRLRFISRRLTTAAKLPVAVMSTSVQTEIESGKLLLRGDAVEEPDVIHNWWRADKDGKIPDPVNMGFPDFYRKTDHESLLKKREWIKVGRCSGP